jgi:hypothetical protein
MLYLQAFQTMTTESKTSTALLKWGQETTDLDKFLRQIMAIVRALDNQVLLLYTDIVRTRRVRYYCLTWTVLRPKESGIALHGPVQATALFVLGRKISCFVDTYCLHVNLT